MSTSAGSYDNDPFASYRLGHSRTDAVDLDVHLESLSQDHRAQPTTYTPSISGYGDEDDTDSYGTRLTSHFSFSTFASATPSVPAHSPTDDNDDRDFALYSRDSTVSQDVELDFESSYQTPCLRSPPPSPTAYKNQPAVVSSRPLTPASPSFPFPSMLRKPSHAWSSGADDVEYDEADEEEEGGFSFARTKPKLPTPPSTPRLEPVVEAGGMSMLELEEEQVAEVEESKPSQISLFLEELSGKLVNLATADRPEMDSSSAAVAIQHKGSKTKSVSFLSFRPLLRTETDLAPPTQPRHLARCRSSSFLHSLPDYCLPRLALRPLPVSRLARPFLPARHSSPPASSPRGLHLPLLVLVYQSSSLRFVLAFLLRRRSHRRSRQEARASPPPRYGEDQPLLRPLYLRHVLLVDAAVAS